MQQFDGARRMRIGGAAVAGHQPPVPQFVRSGCLGAYQERGEAAGVGGPEPDRLLRGHDAYLRALFVVGESVVMLTPSASAILTVVPTLGFVRA